MGETWAQASAAWGDAMRAAGLSPLTVRLRQHHLARLARFAPAGPWLPGPDTVAAFLAHPGWAAATRHSVASSVGAFYRWARRTGRVAASPMASMPPVRVPPGAPRPCPDPVLAAALTHPDPQTALMVMLAAYAGLRRAEIAAVHTRDVTPDGLRVRGKGGRVRVVPLHPALAERLAGMDGWVFPSPRGGHLEADAVGRRVAAALGSGWTCHTLRHRFATRAYAATRDLRAVQELLGHASPATTQLYVRVDDEALRAAVLAAA